MDTKQLMDSYDEIYKKGPFRESEEHYKWVARVLAPAKGKQLLDIACGGGYFLAEVEKAGVDAFGLDFSKVALQVAKKNSNQSRFICGDGEALPFRANYFDFVINLGSLEHFLNPERGLREMARVLKEDVKAVILLPNSYYLMTVWNVFKMGSTGRSSDQKVDRRATKKEWIELMEKNGLLVKEVLKYNYKSPCAPLKHKILRPFIPLNLSYCFLFVCRKA